MKWNAEMLMGRHVTDVGGISMEGITQVRFQTIGAPAVLLKTNTEGDMIRGAGNLFQYFTTHTENAPLFIEDGLIFAVFCRCVFYD